MYEEMDIKEDRKIYDEYCRCDQNDLEYCLPQFEISKIIGNYLKLVKNCDLDDSSIKGLKIKKFTNNNFLYIRLCLILYEYDEIGGLKATIAKVCF